MDKIYLDNAATTKVIPEVKSKICEVLEDNFANPSSLHKLGIESEKIIKSARKNIAEALKVKPNNIIFTGSGTIANNIAIQGAVKRLNKFGKRIITSEIEHKSVLEMFKFLEKEGYEVIYLPVNKKGIIDLNKLKDAVNEETILVSIMAVNNEIGSLQPLKKISQLIKKYDNLYFHVDGVQALGKVNIDLTDLGINLYTVSSHKVNGPKGIGALYINESTLIDKILYGSSQEKGFYPGTENTSGIAGFGEAVQHLPKKEVIEDITKLKNDLKKKLQDEISDVIINTPDNDKAAPHILNVSFADIKGEVLVHSLENDGIYISTGSACTSKKDAISHVIKALHIPKKYMEGSIRISFSPYNTKKGVVYTFKSLKKHVKNLRKIMG
ncbi:MAG TPA: cysteine desulfurase family protein [Halanaerobiales bacterium]|nr:cysteine desulfurase family protein [Halanaerobiales bacterium]